MLQAGGGVGEGLLAQPAELVLKIVVVAEPAVRVRSGTPAWRAAAAIEREVSKAATARSWAGVKRS